MNQTLLTMIVPVYKIKENYLRFCLDSLLNQNSNEYEIILVDDGSPDNCGKICDEYASKSNIVKVIHQENQGVSVARNVGMDMAKSEWISFVDPDDWVSEDMVKTELKAITGAAKDADIILFNVSREYVNKSSEEGLFIEDGYLDSETLAACRLAPFYKLIQNGKVNSYSLSSVLTKVFRRKFIISNNIRYLPEARKGQDRLFCARALNIASKVYNINQCLYYYRCYEESVTNKFNPNIVKLTNIEIDELENIINTYRLSDMYYSCLNSRICTRLYSCMRLYYFNEQNQAPHKQRMKEFKELVNSSRYAKAIKNVSMELLSFQEKLFVCTLKMKLYSVCELMVKTRSRNFKKHLNSDNKKQLQEN